MRRNMTLTDQGGILTPVVRHPTCNTYLIAPLLASTNAFARDLLLVLSVTIAQLSRGKNSDTCSQCLRPEHVINTPPFLLLHI